MNSAIIHVAPASLDEIAVMRDEYRREMDGQIVHDSYHARGLADSYVLTVQGVVVGYGSVAGDPAPPRNGIIEFYVRPPHQGAAPRLFRALIATSGARWIEAQTNDTLLLVMLFDCVEHVTSERVLFADAMSTHHAAPAGVALRRSDAQDRVGLFPHSTEPPGEWVLDLDGEIVATGGLMFHYNPPYGDIFMEVAPAHRRRGYGTYLVQELKRICYEQGGVPAARCSRDNLPSRRTLQRAGMLPIGHIVRGEIA